MDADILLTIEEFFSQYPKRTYPKNQIIIFGGESPEKVFYLSSGKVIQYDISYRGDDVVINIYKAPAFFPMAWAMNGVRNRYFFKTQEESVVRLASPEDVVTFLKLNPEVVFDLLSQVYMGVEGLLTRVVYLMAGSARSRLMYELLIECKRFGKKISDNSYKLHVHESDLAAYSGLARETVSREVKRLRERGVIEFSRGYIVIKDLSQLEKLLGQDG